MLINSSQRGDTIIEVLFAMTIFSLVAIGSLSLMHQGTALAQKALEISLVRAQIDSQADALRYLNRAYIEDYGKEGNASEIWKKVVTDNSIPATTGALDFSDMVSGTNCKALDTTTNHQFALDVTKLNDISSVLLLTSTPIPTLTADVTTYAKILRDASSTIAEGISIQAVGSPTTLGTGFYDFHIRACWQTPGQSTPVTLGTIVRLYEPR